MFKFFKILVLLHLMNDDTIKKNKDREVFGKNLRNDSIFQFFLFVLLCSFIKGFIHRLEPECDENKHFIQYTKYNYLMKLKGVLPRNVLDKKWPPAPQLLQKVGEAPRQGVSSFNIAIMIRFKESCQLCSKIFNTN